MRHGVDVIDLEPPKIRGQAFIHERPVDTITEMPRCRFDREWPRWTRGRGWGQPCGMRPVALAGNAPFCVAVGSTWARAELADGRWVSHGLGLVQNPIAA